MSSSQGPCLNNACVNKKPFTPGNLASATGMGQSMQVPRPWLLWDVFGSVCCKQGRVGGVGTGPLLLGGDEAPGDLSPGWSYASCIAVTDVRGVNPSCLTSVSWEHSAKLTELLAPALSLCIAAPQLFLSHPLGLPNIHWNTPTGSPLP